MPDPRGYNHGFGLPFGGVTPTQRALAVRAGVKWARCGFPEVPDMLDDPEDLVDAGALDTTEVAAQCDAAAADDLNYVFVFLGVPRSVNPNAGSADHPDYDGGQWHYFPTDTAGCMVMAGYARTIAAVLRAKEIEHGMKCVFQVSNEINIPAFSHRTDGDDEQLGHTVAEAAEFVAEIILAVRDEEPALEVWSPSFANRGDIHNPADSTKHAGYWAGAMIAADTRLKGVGADARPHKWIAHPYTGSAPPLLGWTIDAGEAEITTGYGWGAFPGLILFYISLAFAGATAPDGSIVKVGVGEYGAKRTGTEGSFTFTNATQLGYVQQYLFGFDALVNPNVIDDVWLVGPFLYYQALGDPKSLYASAGTHEPFPAGDYYDEHAHYVPTVDPPPVEPPVTTEPLVTTVEIGIPPSIISDSTHMTAGDPRGDVGVYPIAPRFLWFPITNDLDGPIQIDRGSDNLEDTEPGTATITVRNDNTKTGTAGDYDPFNWGSPYFPFVGPSSRIRVKVDGVALFEGDLVGVPVVAQSGQIVTTTFEAVDVLASTNVDVDYKPEAVHTAGQRCHRILERCNVRRRGTREFLFPGVNTYQAGVRQKGKGIDLLHEIQIAEGGLVYANAGGVIVFIDHDHMHESPSLYDVSDDMTAPLWYSALERDEDRDRILNTVVLNNVLGKRPGTAHDETSERLHGPAKLEESLPIATRFGRAFRALQIVAERKDPHPHFSSVTFTVSAFGAATRRPFILVQEVGHVITVKHTPPGDITPDEYSQVVVISGISHTIEGQVMTTTWKLVPQMKRPA